MPACVQSPFSMHKDTCSRMNSVFSLRSIEPNVSTCSSQRMSAAALRSPCSFFILDSMRVTRALSTSTNIYPHTLATRSDRSFRTQYLALSHRPQRFYYRKLLRRIRSFLDERHDHLHHLRRSLLELAMLFR